MPENINTYLHQNLAKAYLENAEYSKALGAFKVAVSAVLQSIETSIDEGIEDLDTIDLSILDSYAVFCEMSRFGQERSEMYDKLSELSASECLNQPSRTKLKLLMIQFLDSSAGIERAISTYTSIIETLSSESGEKSDLVQSVYLSYIKFLKQKNAMEKLTGTIKDRLEQLIPGYSQALNPAKEAQRRQGLFSRITRRLAKETNLGASPEDCLRAANEAYNQGDHEKAFHLHQEGVKSGSVDCAFSLGTFYQLGIGCPIDMVLARQYYLQAAKLGHANAQHHYAALLQMGLGGDVDVDSAVKWYQRASQQNLIPAIQNLAAVYVSGLLGKPMYGAGIHTYLRAVVLGDEVSWASLLTYFSNINENA